ncbi:unnamed protein product [Gemmataceae bacterium]|nr:unnamed protein product [Gemmataceae bacterium]VTT98876.1 unnamed protein product [Gemmataceae bacterium]
MRAPSIVVAVLLVSGCGKAAPTAIDAPAPEPQPGESVRRAEAPRAAATAPPPALLVAPEGVYRHGAIRVVIASAEIDGDDLAVMLLTTTADPTTRSSVSAWSKGATAADDLGNRYRVRARGVLDAAVNEGAAERSGGRFAAGPGLLYSDKPRIDTVRIERAVPKAKHVDLTLSAAAVGAPGVIQFRLPVAMWKTP